MLTDITLGQYFPGNSFIHKLDPRTKLLATLIYIIAIFFAVTPLAYGILTAFAAVVILISRVPWMLVFKSLKPIWIIVILTMLIHMFTAPGEHIVFTWKFLSVTAEGIDMGVKMAVRLILLLLFSSVRGRLSVCRRSDAEHFWVPWRCHSFSRSRQAAWHREIHPIS